MNISSINSVADARRLLSQPADLQAQGKATEATSQHKEQAGVAARQFEAIILRQMLSPVIEPLMNNGLGTGASSSGGGGVYGYMLTDVLANSLSQGGGLGLSRMLEKQLTPTGGHAVTTAAAAYTSGRINNNE